MGDLYLIRHAPTGLRPLCGRGDPEGQAPDPATVRAVVALIGPVDRVWTSPARRCGRTAAALFPDMAHHADPRLWEQDFGVWEGLDPGALPDLGPLSRADLARQCPPGGESYADLCARAAPALRGIAAEGGRAAVVAHAGTVRAALDLALEGPEGIGLAFAIAPLSVTRITFGPGGEAAIGWVNRTA